MSGIGVAGQCPPWIGGMRSGCGAGQAPWPAWRWS